MPDLPVELLQTICDELAEDKKTCLILGRVSKLFSLLSRPLVFYKLAFQNHRDLLDFVALISAPASSIPQPLKCKHLDLKHATDILEASEGIQTLLHSIIVETSLSITLADGGLPIALFNIHVEWKESISSLKVSGGNHTPSTLFTFLASFPNLQFLQLRDVQLVEPWGAALAQYSFPPGVSRLALSHCPALWTFIRLHVLSGGGFAYVKWLYVQEKFTLEGGVVDMFTCFKAPQFEGVKDIVLDAVYDEDDPHINIDMAQFLIPTPFLRMRGLASLRLNFANVPSRVATDFLGWCSLHPSSHTLEIIDVHVPHSATRWPEGSPFEELESFLDGMRAGDPAVTLPGASKAKLIVRGFPGPLPQNISAWGGSVVCGLYGYIMAFQECDWEQFVEGMM